MDTNVKQTLERLGQIVNHDVARNKQTEEELHILLREVKAVIIDETWIKPPAVRRNLKNNEQSN